MAFSTFTHARVSGISCVVPKKEIRLEDELRYFNGDIKKVRRTTKMIGIDCRRVADAGVTAADLCQQAAENLLDGMGIARESIDALIFISQGPDYAIPATACILQDKLGLSQGCAAFDVNQGCTGYTYGLWLASSLIESGACRRVLFLVGEASARDMNPDNRIITPIFGDCGTATLMEYTPQPMPSWFALGTDGSGAEALMVPAGHARFPLPSTSQEYIDYIAPVNDKDGNPWYLNSTWMDGGAIFDFTISVVPPHIKELMAYAGKTTQDIDCLVLHQANKQIVHAIAEKAGFPLEKVPTETVTKYGNQSGASLPAVVCDQLHPLVMQESTRVLMAGFGVGLSWTSAILTLDHIWCSGIRLFETPPHLPTQEQQKDYWLRKFAGQANDENRSNE